MSSRTSGRHRHISNRVQIEVASQEELEQMLRKAVKEGREQLEEKMQELLVELRTHDNVLNLSQLVPHFDGKASAKTIKEYYTKGKRLPEGVDLPLPAHKIGHNVFVLKEMLDKWRMGEVELSDLHSWQRERLE